MSLYVSPLYHMLVIRSPAWWLKKTTTNDCFVPAASQDEYYNEIVMAFFSWFYHIKNIICQHTAPNMNPDDLRQLYFYIKTLQLLLHEQHF